GSHPHPHLQAVQDKTKDHLGPRIRRHHHQYRSPLFAHRPPPTAPPSSWLVSPVVPPVVFPIGAYRKEFAADHLDRLLGKSILDWFIHQGSVAKYGHASGTDQPQNSGNRRGPDAQ